jgi:LCP family protein required for cell wall assembly
MDTLSGMATSVPNQEGLRSLGQHIAASDGRGKRGGRSVDAGRRRSGRTRATRRRGRHRRLKHVLLAGGMVIVLLVAGVAGYGWYLNSKVHRVNVKGLSTGMTQGSTSGTENILMVGSTSRCALTKQTPAYGLCTQGVNGVNADVIMILHLDPSVPSVSILSIPRDLFIPNARIGGANKIDAALYEGPTQLVAAIEEDFGIPIQHYVELNFDTFANVVNALGGITMYFPEPVFDAYSGLNVQTPGCHHLDGVEALQVVRARHLQYKGPGVTATTPHTWPQEQQSDLARIRRDHEFLRVLATKVASRGLLNPITDQSIVASVVSDLTVDSGFSATDMVNMILTYHAVNIDSAPQLQLPVLVSTFGSYLYKGGTYGDIEFTSEPQDQSTINQVLGVTDDTDTMTGARLPSPSSVTVSVLNGTGAYDQASTTASSLSGLGFDVVGTGTSTPVGQEAETVVAYAHRTPSDEAAAQLVARSLSGAVVMAYHPATGGADVTVTTGTNFSVNPTAPGSTKTSTAPKTAPTSSSTSTSTTGTSTTGTRTTGSSTTGTTPTPQTTGFDPPSKAVNALMPYDPRACTASGGEGT